MLPRMFQEMMLDYMMQVKSIALKRLHCIFDCSVMLADRLQLIYGMLGLLCGLEQPSLGNFCSLFCYFQTIASLKLLTKYT